MIVALGTYPIKKLATSAQVKAKVQVMGRLCLLVKANSGVSTKRLTSK